MSRRAEVQTKVIFIVRYFQPFIGGLEKKVLNLASQLICRGISIEVVTSRFQRDWPAHALVKNVSVTRLPSPRIKVFGALVFLSCLSLYLIKNRLHYEIIHAFQVGYSSALAIGLGNILRKKTVLNLSGSGKSGDVRRHRRTPWGLIFLLICRRANRIVALNTQMINELHAIYYKDHLIELIPNGVDLNTYRQSETRTMLRTRLGIGAEKIILYTGRLSQEKGVMHLVKAFASLSTMIPTKLYILGDGPEHKKLQRLIEQLQIGERVVMVPAVEEVLRFLQIADVFVMPSHSEGISNAILEAMACGVPVVATRVPGNVDLIEDGVTGLLVSPDDIKGLAGALLTILTDPEKGENLRRRALEMVQHNYNLNTMVERYCNLYKSLT